MEDERIVALYWNRDESAIMYTSQKYGHYCQSIAYRIVQSKEDAQECENDTYMRAWNSIPPHKPVRLATFLAKIVRNLALDRVRNSLALKRSAYQVTLALEELEECIPAITGDVIQTVEGKLLTQTMEDYLRSQDSQRRKVFLLRYWYLLPVREVAQQMNMTESQITAQLHRMRKQLRQHLEKEGIVI